MYRESGLTHLHSKLILLLLFRINIWQKFRLGIAMLLFAAGGGIFE